MSLLILPIGVNKGAPIFKFVDTLFEDEIFTRAAALAFYTVLGIAPIVVLMIVAFSFFDVDLQASLVREIGSSVGTDAANLLKSIISTTNNHPDMQSFSGALATLGLLISASIIFAQLHNTLNIIFDVESPNSDNLSKWQLLGGFIKTRLFAMGILLILIAIITLSLLISTAIPLLSFTQSRVWLTPVNYLVSFAVFSVLFGLIFRWMPDRKIEIGNALLGGVLTSFLFMIGNFFIEIYLTKSAIGSPYGAAGSLVVSLVWVYYSSLVVFVGAEITYFSLIRKRHAIARPNVIKPVGQQAISKT